MSSSAYWMLRILSKPSLTSVKEYPIPIVYSLNLVDVAKGKHHYRCKKLSEELGAPLSQLWPLKIQA